MPLLSSEPWRKEGDWMGIRIEQNSPRIKKCTRGAAPLTDFITSVLSVMVCRNKWSLLFPHQSEKGTARFCFPKESGAWDQGQALHPTSPTTQQQLYPQNCSPGDWAGWVPILSRTLSPAPNPKTSLYYLRSSKVLVWMPKIYLTSLSSDPYKTSTAWLTNQLA